MKQLFSITLVAALILTTLFSCKKDDDKNANPAKQNKSKEELIIGSWEFASYTITDAPPESTYDSYESRTSWLTPHQKDCDKGSLITFEKGVGSNSGKFLQYDNCEKSNDDGEWILQADVLTIYSTDYQVVQLDNTTLSISHVTDTYYEGSIISGTRTFVSERTATITYKRK